MSGPAGRIAAGAEPLIIARAGRWARRRGYVAASSLLGGGGGGGKTWP